MTARRLAAIAVTALALAFVAYLSVSGAAEPYKPFHRYIRVIDRGVTLKSVESFATLKACEASLHETIRSGLEAGASEEVIAYCGADGKSA